MSKNQEWFSGWFDSPYYHILYAAHDDAEARFFIDNLLQFIRPGREAAVLDLACGKGRHSIYLNNKGHRVTGIDLSPESITHASQYSNDRLRFEVGDMRKLAANGEYDYVFNLFTSFGYFDRDQDNLMAVQAISKALKPGGTLVLDFLNAHKTIANLVSSEVKTSQGIDFNIHRELKDGFIVKTIEFTAENKSFQFQEKVRALNLSDFESHFNATGLQIINTFGDYTLNGYETEQSDRLILVARKQI
jgi:SAM-dependent methyltransferase